MPPRKESRRGTWGEAEGGTVHREVTAGWGWRGKKKVKATGKPHALVI